jgi:hypothetical protein
MPTPKPVQIRSLPGIKRDGTQFEGDNYTDGQWVRFQRGLPRKMAGYKSVTSGLQELVYGMSSFSAGMLQYLHLGMASFLFQAQVDNNGTLAALIDRTPAGFPIDPNNLWQFDLLPSGVAEATDLIAHAAPNLGDISSQVETPIYFGQADLGTALVATGLDPQSGGAAAIGPYLFGFGNSGFIQWTEPNDPSTFQNEARITGQKIIRMLPLRGGGSGPAGIIWSLDTLLRASFVAGVVDPLADPVFAFDTLASELSVLSSRSIIEYDGIFYWWNVDRPLMFNGVVREVPNQLNVNFFLDNLNFAQRQKVFAYKVPRFGEIWWCFPFGDATECNHAIIYNVRENTWYDTALPGSGRSSGIFAQVYPKPFMVDVDLTGTGYTLWQHETGVNSIKGPTVEPIPSFFQTADISMLTAEQAESRNLRVGTIEPDFVQSGEMSVQVVGRSNARAPEIQGELFTFPEDTGNLNAEQQLVRAKESRRLMRFKFASNTPDGDYQMGLALAHLEPADGRETT